MLPTVATWEPTDISWATINSRAVAEIKQRAAPHDVILITGGTAQQPVADAFPQMLSCEWAAGYEGWASKYVCFESYAWRHYCYGKRALGDGRWFDTVIPNFFRPGDFQISEAVSSEYLLYVGRLIERKGILAANDIAKRAGLPLVLAGSGAASYEDGRLETLDGCVLEDVDYRGTVGAEDRNTLMGEAVAVLVPTTYIEPFGAVAVEAQLCGTPAITTDWGAFTETVAAEYRFTTLTEAVEAVERARHADPEAIRASALARYSLDAVAPMYDRWFSQLSTLWADGWYA